MCGCKGCQEITTLDLANNTETITELPTPECGPINSTVKILTCECGITLDIYNSAGILVESNQAGGYSNGEEEPIFFEFFNSTVWESQLGINYTLTVSYNTELSRWELSYYNGEINDQIIIGIYYTENSCPTAIQGWDLNCITVAFNILGVFDSQFTWQDTYINGKKSYAFTSDWSGSDINYEIYWTPDSSTVPGSNAPVGTPGWILQEEITPGVWSPTAYLFNINQCPFGQYITEFGGTDTRYSFTDLGVSGYNIKISPIDCQCCDEKLTISILLSGKPPIEINVEADIQVDSEGNHLIYNGYPYYIFYVETDAYYIFFNSVTNTWVVSTILAEDIIFITQNTSTGLCPFGYYINTGTFLRFWVRGYDCGDQIEEDFCKKVHKKQCEFATKTLNYLKHLQFGNTCCEELDNLKNDRRILEILNCYDTRDIPSNTTDYNTIPYIQIKRLLGC